MAGRTDVQTDVQTDYSVAGQSHCCFLKQGRSLDSTATTYQIQALLAKLKPLGIGRCQAEVHAGVPAAAPAGVHAEVHAGVHAGVPAAVLAGVHAGVPAGVPAGVHAAAPAGVPAMLWVSQQLEGNSKLTQTVPAGFVV